MRNVGRWAWGAIGTIALTLSLLCMPNVRADAQQWISGLLRDTNQVPYFHCVTTNLTDCSGGGGGGAPLPGATSTPPAANQSVGVQAYDTTSLKMQPVGCVPGTFPCQLLVATPAPAPSDGYGHLQTQTYQQGTGAAYAFTLPDKPSSTTLSTTAGTTSLISGVSGQQIQLDFAATEATAANTSINFYFVECSNTGACTSGTPIMPLVGNGATAPTTAGNMTVQFAGCTESNVNPVFCPTAQNVPLPVGYGLGITTVGTTVNLAAVYNAAQH